MQLVDQWRVIEENLPRGWEEVRLTLTTEQPGDLDRAAHVLGSMGAGRFGSALVLHLRRAGGQQGPETARRLFGKLDERRIWCSLAADQVVVADAATPDPAHETDRPPLAGQWDAQLATLPESWGSLLCELGIESTDLLPRVALLCAPLNPTRARGRTAFTFRTAKHAGYGASSGMTARCLERCDEEAIPGRVSIVTVFPETDNVATQGPVFMVGGRPL